MSEDNLGNYGANLVSGVLSDPDVIKKINNTLVSSRNKTDLSSYKNPNDAYSENGLFGSLGKKEKKIDDLSNEEITNGFSSVPRLMGMLGQYVTPPSKISLTQMYEASLDSTLGAILQVGKSLIISNLGDYYHQDKTINKIINNTIDKLGNTTFHYRGLDFLIYGFSVGEKSWGVNSDGYNYIDRITFAPPTNIEFMIDEYGCMNAALQPNLVASQYGIFQGQSFDAPESVFAIRNLIPNMLPFIMVDKEDLFYVGYDNTFNPYGTSPMRRAYKYFELKNLALQMFMTALSRNGVPTMAMYYQKDMIKNPDQLEELKNNADSLSIGGAIYLPGRKGDAYEIDAIKLDSSNINVFLDFVNYCDKMMVRSLGFPQEILLGDGGSYSSGTIQKETYVDMLKLYTETYKESLFKQVVKPIINNNFTKKIIDEDFGKFIPQIRESEKLEKAKLFETGRNSGLLNPHSLEDVNCFRESMGLSKIEKKEDLPINNLLEDESINKTNIRDQQKGEFVKNNGVPFASGEQL